MNKIQELQTKLLAARQFIPINDREKQAQEETIAKIEAEIAEAKKLSRDSFEKELEKMLFSEE